MLRYLHVVFHTNFLVPGPILTLTLPRTVQQLADDAKLISCKATTLQNRAKLYAHNDPF